MPEKIDLTGQTFGRWTVIRFDRIVSGKAWWVCRCACGCEKSVNGKHLRSGESTQCRGCVHRTHGATNGKAPTSEYVIWQSMVARCHCPTNHAYPRYGGRGIVVCERWRHSFENFLSDMGARPEGMTLDRIDNAKGYAPDNCRWATPTEQNRNRRDNRMLTARGETMCVAAWAEKVGVKETLIRSRLKRGWPPERALLINGPSYAKGAESESDLRPGAGALG